MKHNPLMRPLVLALALLFSWSALGQIFNPVDWEITSQNIDENTYDIIFTANMVGIGPPSSINCE